MRRNSSLTDHALVNYTKRPSSQLFLEPIRSLFQLFVGETMDIIALPQGAMESKVCSGSLLLTFPTFIQKVIVVFISFLPWDSGAFFFQQPELSPDSLKEAAAHKQSFRQAFLQSASLSKSSLS